jgi:hypothetical protein
LAAQPLFDDGSSSPSSGAVGSKNITKPDPATSGVKKKGTALRKAVAKVKALPWNKRLKDAQTKARQSGKPILMLQTLGEIGGLA